MNTTISQYRRLLKKLLAIEDERGKLGLRFDSSLIDHLPQSPGVYRIFEAGAAWNKSVYVGNPKFALSGNASSNIAIDQPAVAPNLRSGLKLVAAPQTL